MIVLTLTQLLDLTLFIYFSTKEKIEKMRKIISFMHISLDGFVAGLNGELD